MAYNKYYYSNFTDFHGQRFTINLYKNASSTTAKEVRINDLKFNNRLNGRILVSAVDLGIVNTYNYNEFDDFFTAQQRDWKIEVVDRDTPTSLFFRGYLVIDTVERSMMDKYVLNLTFSDELGRLSDYEVQDVSAGSIYSMLEIIKDGLDVIDNRDIYINNRLFYFYHIKNAGRTMYEQTYLDADFFYENNVEKRNYLDVINDFLKCSNAYLYGYKGDYYIERYNDVSTNSSWVKVDKITGVGAYSGSQRARYNKQNDFNYTSVSQTETSNAGWSEFTLNVDNEEYYSILPNYFPEPLATYNANLDVDHFPYLNATDLSINANTWYIVNEATDVSTGQNNYGIDNYIKYNTSTTSYWGQHGKECDGVFYQNYITFNSGDSTQLQLRYKLYITASGVQYEPKYYVRFILRKQRNGAYPNYFIVDPSENGELKLIVGETGENYDSHIWNVEVQPNDNGSNLIEFSKSLELNSIKPYLYDNDDFIFYFLPTKIVSYSANGKTEYTSYSNPVVIGDFEIKIQTENVDNQYVYTVNDGFINKEEDDLPIYDMDSYNFKNGMFELYNGDRSRIRAYFGWTDDGAVTYEPLADHYVKTRVGYGYKSRKNLSGSILFKSFHFIKPLSIISDNNIPGLEFLVSEYSYNFINSVYSVNAPEYSLDKQEINIE